MKDTNVGRLDRDYYTRAWSDEGIASWDIDRPQRAFQSLAEEGVLQGRVLDVGCGSGAHAVLFARTGCQVTGVDFVAAALERARKRGRDADVTVEWIEADVLRWQGESQPFAHVIDCGFLHSLREDEAEEFMVCLTRWLAVNGTYNVLCFADGVPWKTGPRAFRYEALSSLLTSHFRDVSIVSARSETLTAPSGVPAWFARAANVKNVL